MLQDRSVCRLGRAIQLGIFAGLGQNIGRKMQIGWYRAITETPDEAQLEYERAK